MVLVVITQLAAVIAGILVVRSMPQVDYAAYSAATAAIAAALVVADSGTGSVLMARLAASMQDSRLQLALMRAALSVRRRISFIVLLVVGGGLIYIFIGLRIAAVPMVLSLAIICVTVSNSLLRTLYMVEVQLQRRFVDLALADASGGVFRLLMSAGAALASFASGAALVVFLFISLVASLLQTTLVRRVSAFRRVKAEEGAREASVFREAVRATLPWTALMIVGEQLVNVLLTAFGNATAIAEIGALTRYAMAFSLVSSLVGTVLTTTAAHTARERRPLVTALTKTIVGGVVLCAGYVSGLWLLRGPLLALLGPQYAHLDTMFLVLSVSSALQFFSSAVLGTWVHSRGWVHGNWIFGPCLGLWVAWTVLIAQPRDGMSAAWVMVGLQMPTLVSQITRIVVGLGRDVPPEGSRTDGPPAKRTGREGRADD